MNEIELKKYDKWNEHLKTTKEKSDYSQKRMDLLIISLSGASLYLIFQTLKEIKTGKIELENTYLLIPIGILLILTIISNFVSQLSGYKANFNEEEYIQIELELLENKKLNKKKKQSLNKFMDVSYVLIRTS